MGACATNYPAASSLRADASYFVGQAGALHATRPALRLGMFANSGKIKLYGLAMATRGRPRR